MSGRVQDELVDWRVLEVKPSEVREGDDEVYVDGVGWVEVFMAPWERDGVWFIPIDTRRGICARPSDTIEVRRRVEGSSDA